LQESLPINQSRKKICAADHEQKRPVNLGNCIDEVRWFQYLQIVDQPWGRMELGANKKDFKVVQTRTHVITAFFIPKNGAS